MQETLYVKDRAIPHFYVRTLPERFQVHELDQKVIWEGKNGTVRLDNINHDIIVVGNGTLETIKWKESHCKILNRNARLIGYVDHKSPGGFSDFYNVFRISLSMRPYQQTRKPVYRAPVYNYRWNYYLWIDN